MGVKTATIILVHTLVKSNGSIKILTICILIKIEALFRQNITFKIPNLSILPIKSMIHI